MTSYAELVAVGVSEVHAVVVLVVLGSQAGCTFRRAAVCECHGVGLVNEGSAPGKESNHLTVSGLVR